MAARSGLNTICTRPSRSRRSTKMTPPWSRRRWTQPISVTVCAEIPAVDASTVVSALQCVLRRALRAAFGWGEAGRRGPCRGAAAPRRDASPGQFRGLGGGRQRRGRAPSLPERRRRGETTPIEMMYLSASSTDMSSSRTRALRNHHEVAAGRVRRRRHVDADVLAREDDRRPRRPARRSGTRSSSSPGAETRPAAPCETRCPDRTARCR